MGFRFVIEGNSIDDVACTMEGTTGELVPAFRIAAEKDERIAAWMGATFFHYMYTNGYDIDFIVQLAKKEFDSYKSKS